MKPNLNKIKESKTTKELLEFSIINIDKPSGPTSFSVSEFVCKKFGLRKTSHFGTLDPKVTGVLPIALNRGCKLTGFFLGEDKEYVGIMRTHEEVSLDEIKKIIEKGFIGKIKQTPPVKSRVKRQEREREIKSFEILEKEGKDFLFRSEVQGGTYIRKLIDDLGKEIGGAHMLELRRVCAGIFEEMGEYPLVDLYELEKIYDDYQKGDDKRLREILIPGEIICRLYPSLELKKEKLKEAFSGKPLKKSDLVKEEKIEGEKFLLFCGEKFIGIYRKTNEKEFYARAEFVLQPI